MQREEHNSPIAYAKTKYTRYRTSKNKNDGSFICTKNSLDISITTPSTIVSNTIVERLTKTVFQKALVLVHPNSISDLMYCTESAPMQISVIKSTEESSTGGTNV